MIKKWYFVILSLVLISTAILTGCSSTDKAKVGDTVKVAYTLKLEDGTVYDASPEGEPFEFTLGNNEVIVGFEDAVKGMKVGETKTVTLSPDKAYGEYYDELVIEVERSKIPAGTEPKVGMYITGQSPDGTTSQFLIIAVNDTTITVDGNVPLAGKTLMFELTLIEIVAEE